MAQFISDRYAELPAYSPVKALSRVAAEARLPAHALLKLDANENSFGAPLATIQAASNVLIGSHRYPDPDRSTLAAQLAEFVGRGNDKARALLGAGSDDILEQIVRVCGAERVLVSPPTFGMYAYLARVYGAKVVTVPRQHDTHAVDIDAMVEEACGGANADKRQVVFIASPNNPTGALLATSDARRLLRQLRERAPRTLCVIDEAYMEFVDDSSGVDSASIGRKAASAVALLDEYENLFVVRTLSKWAGIASLRFGYGFTQSKELTNALLATRQPYHVNDCAAAAATEAIRNGGEGAREAVRLLRQTTKEMQKRLSSAEFSPHFITVEPGDANFLLIKATNGNGESLYRALLRCGVIVRYFGKQGGALEAHVRLSAPMARDLPRVLRAFAAARDGDAAIERERALLLGALCGEAAAAARAGGGSGSGSGGSGTPAAFLFDLDGVLADVSQSYRVAIVRTAEHFGVRLPPNAVAEAKAAGDANNDWIVTHRLIEKYFHTAESANDAHVPPSFEAVKAHFEHLYHTELWRNESLLVTAERLRALAAVAPLALVTGRPREPDTRRFLEQYSLADVFGDRIVCMGETELPKPSPLPVLKALQMCGIDDANRHTVLFFGDTVDDMRAGADAGVNPIGVLLREDEASGNQSAAMASLVGSGAMGVVGSGCGELLDCIVRAHATATAHAAAAANGAAVALRGSGSGGGEERIGRVQRNTFETSIECAVNLDGTGKSEISTKIGFFDHMLSAFSKHGRFDVRLQCNGDTHIDDHHTVEDCAIALGEAFKEAIGARRGIARFGSAFAPLDDALCRSVVDVSSRPYACVQLHLRRERIGDVSTEMLTHAFQSFATSAALSIHVDVQTPDANEHHKAEAAFKSFGIALRHALARDNTAGVPSTKGVL